VALRPGGPFVVVVDLYYFGHIQSVVITVEGLQFLQRGQAPADDDPGQAAYVGVIG
jgi:hypothetical protein